jgi:hypothetical protein
LTASLAPLLADKMLVGDLVDMMVEHLALRLKGDSEALETYEFVTLSHMDLVKLQWEGRNQKNSAKPSSSLTHLEARMRKSPRTLLFPLHLLEGKHYTGFAINFKEEFICYGM